MLGVNDFIGYYDWTFEFLRRTFGEESLKEYWGEAVARDALREFYSAVTGCTVKPLVDHWSYSAVGEECQFQIVFGPDYFRYDMWKCPSLGYLIKKGKSYYPDYCSHCIGWVEPLLSRGKWEIWHEHNHLGKCWWEFKKSNKVSQPGEIAGKRDVRLSSDWEKGKIHPFPPP